MKTALLAALLLTTPVSGQGNEREAAAEKPAGSVQVLSYNVTGIPVFTPSWSKRRRSIAESIRRSDFDIAALQEVWLPWDAPALHQESGMPHMARAGCRGIHSNGLVILSRHPIVEVRHHAFTTRPASLLALPTGETVARKGVVMARVKTPEGLIDVYDTHMVADYPSQKNTALRLGQVFELYEMVREHSWDRPMVLLGDLNIPVRTAEYGIVLDLLGLQDACVEDGKEVCGKTNMEEGRRIDYVLTPAGNGLSDRAKTVFDKPWKGKWFDYSDHAGVEARLLRKAFRSQFNPDPAKRVRALEHISRRTEELREAMEKRIPKRGWIPLYGLIHSARYQRETSNLRALEERVRSELIRARKRARTTKGASER